MKLIALCCALLLSVTFLAPRNVARIWTALSNSERVAFRGWVHALLDRELGRVRFSRSDKGFIRQAILDHCMPGANAQAICAELTTKDATYEFWIILRHVAWYANMNPHMTDEGYSEALRDIAHCCDRMLQKQ